MGKIDDKDGKKFIGATVSKTKRKFLLPLSNFNQRNFSLRLFFSSVVFSFEKVS
jgi:hypothetical protein